MLRNYVRYTFAGLRHFSIGRETAETAVRAALSPAIASKKAGKKVRDKAAKASGKTSSEGGAGGSGLWRRETAETTVNSEKLPGKAVDEVHDKAADASGKGSTGGGGGTGLWRRETAETTVNSEKLPGKAVDEVHDKAADASGKGSTGGGGGTGAGADCLGRRLVRLVSRWHSAATVLETWKKEGHAVRKNELKRIVRELRRLKRFKHALEICEWMTQQPDMQLLEGDYALQLDLIAKVRSPSSAEKFFVDLPDSMKTKPTYTALLHTYVRNRDCAKAEALMEQMSELGFLNYTLPYNHMLSLYISTGQLEKVPAVLEELKKKTVPDLVTYNLWLTVCSSKCDVDNAEKAFLALKAAKLEPDWVTYSTLSNLYIKKSLFKRALMTLKEMEKRVLRKDRAAHSSLISLYTNMGNKDGIDRIWKKLKSIYVKMNDAEYTCMLSSLVKLDELKEAEMLYSEWQSVSGTGDCRVSNVLLAAYINKNQMEVAEKFYNDMSEKGIKLGYTTWELLTWGYLKQNEFDKALDYFKKAVGSIKKRVPGPGEKLIRAVFEKLEEDGNIEGAERLLFTLNDVGHVTTEMYNLLLRTYAKAGKTPLVIAERMKKDKVELDEETHELIKLTSKVQVGEVSESFT